ncbi:hypothetical protein ACFLUJ_02535, partial [Chloroflexota bacterium]
MKVLIGALIGVVALSILSPSLFAVELHEDPETAKQVFSGISLFEYYSESLDFVLQRNPAEVKSRLEKLPFANIPQSLEEATDTFASACIGISYQVVEIDEDLYKLRMLIEQYRLDEAIQQAAQTSDNLSQAYNELQRMRQTIETAGIELKIPSAPVGSDLSQSYEKVLERIDRIEEMLALYNDLLANLLLKIKQMEGLKPTDITLEEFLESTDITLEEFLESTDI